MTGRKIIIIHDNGGWAVFKTKNWGERGDKSDRKKGIRKALNRQIRRRLKQETNKIIEENAMTLSGHQFFN